MRIRELYSKGMGVIFRLFLISKSPKNENKKDYKTYKYLEKKYSDVFIEINHNIMKRAMTNKGKQYNRGVRLIFNIV